MDGFAKDGYWWFNCGCRFEIIGPPWGKSKVPRIRSISDLHNPKHTINFQCPATWELLGKGWTKGVFQLESPLGRQWCKKLKPEHKEHMAALGALLRPGCLRAMDSKIICKDCRTETKEKEGEHLEVCPACGSDDFRRIRTSMTEHYCKRKNFEEEVELYHPSIDPILGPTYNVLAYQEQSMKIAVACANFNLQEADVLRKAIGKKLPEEMAKVKKLFLEKAKESKIVPIHQAEEIFGWIEKSQRYAFNKSHSASYGETGYACAYNKTHFPLSFYSSWLTFAQEKPDPHAEIAELVNDARITSNIKIRPPDIRFLKDRMHSDGEHIYFGLQDVKGVGESQVKKLHNTLTELNVDKQKLSRMKWMEFLLTLGNEISSTAMTAFIRSGALSYMKVDRTVMMKDYEIWSNLTKKEQKFIKEARFDINETSFNNMREALSYLIQKKGYHNEKRGVILAKTLDGLVNLPYILQDTIDYLVYSEEELLGVALTCHITDGILGAMETCTCKDIIKGFRGYSVLKVTLDEVRPWTCRRGESAGKKMAFIKASDNTCQLDNIVAFPNVYAEYTTLLNDGNIVYLSGKTSDTGSFVVERVYEHSET